MFEDIQHYCPAHKICRENGNFAEKTCKYANNTERKMTLQCAAGIIIQLQKLVDAQRGGKS
jgi:hypothetical protein